VLRQSVAIGTAGALAHSWIGLLTMPPGNHRGKRMGKLVYFLRAGSKTERIGDRVETCDKLLEIYAIYNEEMNLITIYEYGSVN
jgi:hypothetical protein